MDIPISQIFIDASLKRLEEPFAKIEHCVNQLTEDELLQQLTETTEECRDVIASLSPNALTDERTVQGFDETVLSAVYDSIYHLSGHSQENVYITRMRKGNDYQFKWPPSTPEEGLPRGN